MPSAIEALLDRASQASEVTPVRFSLRTASIALAESAYFAMNLNCKCMAGLGAT
jgi:hypothetical protein